MKKIIMDSSWLGKGGIGRFTFELTHYLKKIDSREFYKNCASPLATIVTAFKSLSVNKKDVIFFPGYIPPLFCACNYIFTIHDLNHIDIDDNASRTKDFFYEYVIKHGCRRAEYIFTVSDFSRNRIAEWSGVAKDKIINVGNGVSKNFNASVTPYKPGYEYLLCVSNRKTHKNEKRIIHSFARSDMDPTIKLVLTGKPTNELLALIDEVGCKERVIFTGFILEDDLPGLYRGSLALIFPSLYEGFGLPVIEAMACGVPVVTSTVTSLPEVAGDAALLVDPESVEQITAAINEIVNNTETRAMMIDKGFAQAKLFSWEEVARKISKVFEEI